MPDIDPLSQQLGEIQGTLKGLEGRISDLDKDMERRLREVWSRIGEIEKARTPSVNGWQLRAYQAGTAFGGLEAFRHLIELFK